MLKSSFPSATQLKAGAAAFYVLSGVTQPLLMTVAKDAGLADPTCQLYMLFYQLGPASVGLALIGSNRGSAGQGVKVFFDLPEHLLASFQPILIVEFGGHLPSSPPF
jgi:hypothetical protein